MISWVEPGSRDPEPRRPVKTGQSPALCRARAPGSLSVCTRGWGESHTAEQLPTTTTYTLSKSEFAVLGREEGGEDFSHFSPRMELGADGAQGKFLNNTGYDRG
jgi:hypothetical protein